MGVHNLIKYVLDAGVKGVFVNGSTGECAALEDEESKEAIEYVVEEVDGRVPVLVGVSAVSTRKVIQNTKLARQMGADAVVITTPYYFPYNDGEIIEFYQDIATHSELPIFIYNNPERTNLFVNESIIGQVKNQDNIIGVKDSSKDFVHFQNLLWKIKKSSDFLIFQGAEELILAALMLGGDGAVPGISNLIPDICVKIYEKAKEKNFEEASRLQQTVCDLMKIYKYGSWISSIKAGLSVLGICGPTVTKPLATLPNLQMNKIKKTMREVGLI